MSSTFILPSYFETPFTTSIPGSRYDSKGRQLSFVETEVQRLERMALVNASKSRSSRSSPTQSRQPSSPSRVKLIAEPYDPIELMANRLAEEYFFNDFSFLSNENLDSTPEPFPTSTSGKSSSKSSSFEPGRRCKRPSLSSIPEEE